MTTIRDVELAQDGHLDFHTVPELCGAGSGSGYNTATETA